MTTSYYPSWDPTNALPLDPGFATQPGANGRPMTMSPFQTAQFANGTSPEFQGAGGTFNNIPDNQSLTRQGADPTLTAQQTFDPRQAFMQAIMQPFQFDRNAVDTSMFDKMLENQHQQIENTRGLAQNNYNISNKNIGDMYAAFQNHLAQQAPAIDQRYAQANQDTANIFDNATQKNNDWLNNYNAQKAEMLQRLGIQAAGNAPDLVGAAVAQGNNSQNESKTSRLALNDADKQTQQNWFQNMNAMAGNEGLQRQQDLARSLANINTNLNNQYLTDQTQNDQNKLNFIGQMYNTAFQNYQNERDFNEKAFENYNQLMLQQPKYDAQTALAQAREMAAQAQMAKNSGGGGITGLDNQFDPSVANAFQTMVGNGQDPTQIPQFYQSFMHQYGNSKQVDPNAFFQYLNAYNNKKTNTGGMPMNITLDGTDYSG